MVIWVTGGLKICLILETNQRSRIKAEIDGQNLMRNLKQYKQRKLKQNSAPIHWLTRVSKNLGAGFLSIINGWVS